MSCDCEYLSIRSELTRPADFNEFWLETKQELAGIPVEWERVPDPDANYDGRQIDIIRYRSIEDDIIYGWFAAPRYDKKPLTGYLWLPGYSLGNPPPGPESLFDGTATFGINLHGNMPGVPYVHPAKIKQDYITQGIENPKRYIFRKLIAHCMRAVEVLAQQPEIDPERIVVGGMSQGGGLALVVSALMPSIAMCFADMPWLCDLRRAIILIDRERYRRNPKARPPDSRIKVVEYAERNPVLADEIYRSYSYIDPLNHAGNIKCPAQVSAGGRDPSCKPPTIFSVYNEVVTEKEMLYLPNAGHRIEPEMRDAHSRWLISR